MNEWDVKSFEWDLRPESVVVECGAFHGRWALEIMQRYNPHLYMFEPQTWLIPELQATFRTWDKAKIYNYGLGMENKQATLWSWGNDGATFMDQRDARDGGGMAQLREVREAFEEIGLEHIDLMLINIEGYEFKFIPYLFGRGIFPKWLMVQMHTTWGNQKDLYQTIERYYRILWDYGAVLSAWEFRNL